MLSWYLRAVALLLVVALASTNANAVEVLEVGVEYYDLRIAFDTTQTFALGALEPNQEYEVRTSSPGLFAAEFFVTFVCDLESLTPENPTQRALLNVEKAMFKTNSAGLVTRCTHTNGKATKYGVKVFARLEGFTTDPKLYNQPVRFNLILDKVWLGIPNRVIGVLIFAVVLIVAIIVVVLNMSSLVSPLSIPLSGSAQVASRKLKSP